MKPRPLACISLAIFAASAWLAWTTAARPHQRAGPVSSRVAESPAQRAEALFLQHLLSQLAHELVAGPKPDGTVCSAREMDAIFSREGRHGALRYGRKWAEHDPEAMCAWIERRGSVRTEDGLEGGGVLIATLFRLWASRDADAAVAGALRLSLAPARAQALVSALQVIWTSDPEKARQVIADHGQWLEARTEVLLLYNGPGDLEFLTSLPAGKTRGKLLSLVLADAMNSTSSSAHAAATAIWKSLTREQRLELAAGGFMQRDDFLSLYITDEKNKPLARFPEEAELLRSYAESSGNIKAAGDYLRLYGDEWAAKDASSAVTWARSHLKGGEQVDGVIRLIRSAARVNFDGAIKAWQLLPPGAMRSRAAGTILSAAPQDRKSHARALLETLSDHERGIAEIEAGTQH